MRVKGKIKNQPSGVQFRVSTDVNIYSSSSLDDMSKLHLVSRLTTKLP